MREAQRLVQRQLDRPGPERRNTSDAVSLRRRAEQLKILASVQTGNAELVQTSPGAGFPFVPQNPA